jgi:hypothetical protein
MRIAGASFLFINSHLPAHQGAVRERNQAYRSTCDRLPLPHRDHLNMTLQLISTPLRRSRMVTVVDRFDHVVWLGAPPPPTHTHTHIKHKPTPTHPPTHPPTHSKGCFFCQERVVCIDAWGLACAFALTPTCSPRTVRTDVHIRTA